MKRFYFNDNEEINQDVYTAGPLFTPSQIKTCEAIETALKDRAITFFSPRLDTAEAGKRLGTATQLLAKTDENTDKAIKAKLLSDRLAAAKDIFEANCKAIETSLAVVACIDDRDPGTMFEIGYAVAKDIPVFTYSTQGYGVNIMIGQSTVQHFTDIATLVQCLDECLKDNADFGSISQDTIDKYSVVDEREQI